MSNLSIYLILEGAMLRLDALDGANTEADAVRDLMDPVWYRLDEHERGVLDARNMQGEPTQFCSTCRPLDVQKVVAVPVKLKPVLDADGKPVVV